MGLIIKEKEFVIPGEVIAEGMDFLPSNGVYRDGEQIVAQQIGLLVIENRLIKLIPLNGTYKPKIGDVVIGQVVNIGFNGWTIDIGYSNLTMLSVRDATSDFLDKKTDLSKYYNFDDYVVAKILNVSKSNLIDLTMKSHGTSKLENGMIVDISSSKVPRVIGKQGSMISLIKNLSGCNVVVGQNGKVWVSGENFAKVVKAIELIEKESHISGLTEKIEKLLGGKDGLQQKN